MMKANSPATVKVTVDLVTVADKQISAIKEVKRLLINAKCTFNQYHDFYNDPNQ